MSNYTQITSFTPKDSLATGNPSKVIRGADFDGEFSAISTAVASKADTTTVSDLTTTVSGKQDTLVSGTNIKTINGSSVLGSGDLTVALNKSETVSVIGTNTAATTFTTYVFTADLTLTLPATPTVGDWVSFQNSSGVSTCVIARNGSNIMSLAEDMTVATLYAPFTLVYADATRGWVFK